ncbi:MAG TPA: NAD(P)-binding domain-containing protein [Actinomycetota bacterium]|nr:NAD(P)-binding domain-containing protein [Actinomycetota bacterium]
MRIAVLGTGVVGRTLAARAAEVGHETRLGTRDVEASLASTNETRDGSGTLAQWQANHPDITIVTFADAVDGADIVLNGTNGEAALAVLEAAGNLAGKVILDISNPLDFSQGFPPRLFVSNDDSLAEQLQRHHPDARIVKSLNTVTASVMADPRSVAEGDHTMFVAGDDADAKAAVRALLEEFGWRDVLDLGDLKAARAMEMYLPLWLRLMGAAGTPMFNVKVAR